MSTKGHNKHEFHSPWSAPSPLSVYPANPLNFPDSRRLMSRPPNDVPQTPDRKGSSSALFNAFRNLTGAGRSRNAVPVSLPPTTGVAATDLAQVRAGVGTGTWLGRPGPVTNGSTTTDSAQGTVVPPTVPALRWEDTVGGPPELLPILERLDSKRPIQERLESIPQICRILDSYPIDNALVLWNACSDLLDYEDQTEASHAVYNLLRSCVRLPSITSIERGAFFKIISERPNWGGPFTRFQILLELTNGGRNVEAIESSIAPFVSLSLQTCFADARQARKASRKVKTEGPIKEDRALDELFQFVVSVIKFNGKIFQEGDLETLLNQIIAICRETTREADMENSVHMFDTLVTYTQIPKASLKPCLEVLCDVHRQIQALQEHTWKALSNLLRSHLGPASVSVLLDILMDTPNLEGTNRNAARGAINVLQRLVLANRAEGLPKVAFSQLLPALKASVTKEHHKLENDVADFIASILADAGAKVLLLEEDDWTDLIDTLEMCARELEAWASASDPADEEARGNERSSEPSASGDSKTQGYAPKHKSRNLGQIFRNIFDYMECLQSRADFVQRAAIMDLFIRLSPQVSNSAVEALLRYHAEERLLSPSNSNWSVACQTLLDKFFRVKSRPRPIRQRVVELLRETYFMIDGVQPDEVVRRYAMMILQNIPPEEDTAVLDQLVDFAVSVVTYGSEDLFDQVLALLKIVLDKHQANPSAVSPDLGSGGWVQDPLQPLGSVSNAVVKGILRMFTRSLNRAGRKTAALYDVLLDIAKSTSCETDARITALRLLFRVRCDSRHALFVMPSSEDKIMASVLCRTAETAIRNETLPEISVPDPQKQDEDKPSRESRALSNPSPHSSLTKHTTRTGYVSNRSSKNVPAMWMHAGPEGLPEEPPHVASTVCFSIINPEDQLQSDARHVLKLALWLEIVIGLLQSEDDWDVYSYVLAHLGPQLTNHSLFHGCVPQIRMLRNILCDQIRSTSFNEPPPYTSLKKGDVAVCLYHLLANLISYHQHFEKSEEDDMVRVFVLGIGSWDRASKWCIHAMSVCCHELPLSTSKSLGLIVQKMSEVITQPQLAVHILEFLAVLARLPELYYNFHEENYKTVFGVSFRYLQYARDQRERAANQSTHRIRYSGFGTLRHSSGSREFNASSEVEIKSRTKTAAEDLPQYLHALAYHVITFWFIALKLEDRKRYMSWITKNLIYRDRADREVIEEHAQVTIDMMERFAYSDRDETAPDADFALDEDGEVSKKTWIVGYSLLTIETAAKTGLSQITIRRPSATKYLTLRPLLTKPPRHQVPIYAGLSAEAFYTSSYVGVLPDDIFQTFYSPLSFPSTLSIIKEEPVPLPADDMTTRAISSFDRNSTVDNHKVGVIYVADGQVDETQILSNIMGSSDYTSFIADLGTLTKLKGAKFNTAGLDREYDSDGEFTYCWRDRCTEIVFHIATMMPTDPSNDQSVLRKKSHIGNDFVTIVFNNSGKPYGFSTIASQFNYVVIVITPEARSSFVETRLESNPDGRDRAYKVQVLCQPGFPEISPAAVVKVVTGKHLSAYVRLIALNACFFSLVWAAREGGESISPWRNRLREIKKLRDRHCETTQSAASLTPPPTSAGPFGQGFSSVHPRDSGAAFKRTSVVTVIGENTNRGSVFSGSGDTERSGSDR